MRTVWVVLEDTEDHSCKRPIREEEYLRDYAAHPALRKHEFRSAYDADMFYRSKVLKSPLLS